MFQYLAAAPWWAPWLIAVISLATALVALCYARIVDLSVARRLASGRGAEQRLRRYRALQLLSRARELWERSEGADARAEMQARVGDLLQRALELDPENPKVRTAWVRLLQITSHREETDGSSQVSPRLEPRNPGADEGACEIAELISRGRHREAYERCQEALELHPNCVPLMIETGRVAAEMGRYEEAEKALRRSLQLDPSSPLAHELLASLLSCQDRLAEAEVAARTAIELDEANATAHNTLGVIYRKTGRVEAAAVSCRRATQLEPGNVSAHVNLGVALRQLGRLTQSESAYRRAIELEPRNAIAHSNLGVALKKQDRDAEAEASYMKAIEIDPTYTPAWLNLAIALQKRGALDEAEAAYRCALEFDVSTRLPGLGRRSSATAA